MEMLLGTNSDNDTEDQRTLLTPTHKAIGDLEYIVQQRALFTSNIHLADQKSGYIALLHGVLITGISSIMQSNEILARLTENSAKWLFVFTLVMLFISFVANMLAFIPRVLRQVSRDNSWTDIANADVNLIVHSITVETHSDRMKRIASQVKTLAQICNDKFKYIKHSIIFLSISTLSSIVLYLKLVLI